MNVNWNATTICTKHRFFWAEKIDIRGGQKLLPSMHSVHLLEVWNCKEYFCNNNDNYIVNEIHQWPYLFLCVIFIIAVIFVCSVCTYTAKQNSIYSKWNPIMLIIFLPLTPLITCAYAYTYLYVCMFFIHFHKYKWCKMWTCMSNKPTR